MTPTTEDNVFDTAFRELDALSREIGDLRHEFDAIKRLPDLTEHQRAKLAYDVLSQARGSFQEVCEKVWSAVLAMGPIKNGENKTNE